MKNENSKQKKATYLRKRASEKLKPHVLIDNLSDADVRKLAYELQVHQIELEMQNEEILKAQILLEESNLEYTDLYDFAPVGYITFDNDRQIVKANLTIARMLGEERSLLNNKTFYRHIVKEDSDIFYLHHKNVLQNKEEERCELRFRRRDGVLLYAQLNSIYVKDSEGIEFCRTSILDITKRKTMEDELLKTQKLESIGVLAGGIAHDFNNILTAILGNANMADIFINAGKTDRTLEAISNIVKATIRAKDLTQKLLTFAKGGAPVTKTVVISELIRESTNFSLGGTNVKPKFSIPDTLWAVDVDEAQVNRVINNLVMNAAQAMPKGGIVNISAENITEEHSKKIPVLKHGKYIMISVKDHGIGISRDHIEDIFDPYFTTKQTGSGLGLTASYHIITNHGGLVTVESELSVGTTFYIYLLASSNTIAKKNDEVEYKLVDDKPVTGSGKILIMDDDLEIRDIGSQMLNYIGYEVKCAVDGAETIEMYKEARESGKPFDVVVMDLTIPGGMGGETTIRKLHEIDPKAKAIVYSGYSNNPIMAEFEKYGFKGVVSKPFVLKEMNDVLQMVIKG